MLPEALAEFSGTVGSFVILLFFFPLIAILHILTLPFERERQSFNYIPFIQIDYIVGRIWKPQSENYGFREKIRYFLHALIHQASRMTRLTVMAKEQSVYLRIGRENYNNTALTQYYAVTQTYDTEL